MSELPATTRPRSVRLDEPAGMNGFNGVAYVAAAIHNQRNPRVFLSARGVAERFNISDRYMLGLVSALQVVQKLCGAAGAPAQALPWESAAPSGHYAVFCIGRPYVLYAYRAVTRAYYVYDPQQDSDRSLDELQQAGLSPFIGYHIAD